MQDRVACARSFRGISPHPRVFHLEGVDQAVSAAHRALERVGTGNSRGVRPRVTSSLLPPPAPPETHTSCLLYFLFGVFSAQDVAVMGSPRSTDMNQGLRRLTRTHRSPLPRPVAPFDARELGGSLPGVRPRHRSLHGSQHGEKPQQQQRQHQGSAPVQFYRPAAWRQ